MSGKSASASDLRNFGLFSKPDRFISTFASHKTNVTDEKSGSSIFQRNNTDVFLCFKVTFRLQVQRLKYFTGPRWGGFNQVLLVNISKTCFYNSSSKHFYKKERKPQKRTHHRWKLSECETNDGAGCLERLWRV